MRFRAWRGLSSTYRAAVEGHSPWAADVIAPEPLVVPDALAAPVLAAHASLFRAEGIAALAFIPLVTRGRLLGKFMLYYDEPHPFAQREVETARAIANHLASVISRFAAVSRLEETVRQNELFAGVLAHDLRNPLGAIMTAAQLMLARRERASAALEPDTRPLSRILSTGQRMSVMIDQLLDFTRARSGGGIGVTLHEVDLSALLQQAADELELAHPEWIIQREVHGDARGMWDSDRLLQVISNLVGNAGEHGRPGTPIVVRLDGTDAARVSLDAHNSGAIPRELLPHLFVPFRSTQHRRAGARGLGLGLFIIREIVQAHGGTIDVTSDDAAGTTFRIDLPRHPKLQPAAQQQSSTLRASRSDAAEVALEESAAASAVPLVAAGAGSRSAAPPVNGSSARNAVLIVDDDVDIREALAEILVQRGFAVTSAPNGAAAAHLLKGMAEPPSVILLDLMMPVMDGYEFLALRRSEPLLAAIPVIVITAAHGVDRARLGDTTPVIPKPIELSKLMSTLQQLGAVSRVS
jgi:signal transduction histidine kinase/CheY-like chemotaxis protein